MILNATSAMWVMTCFSPAPQVAVRNQNQDLPCTPVPAGPRNARLSAGSLGIVQAGATINKAGPESWMQPLGGWPRLPLCCPHGCSPEGNVGSHGASHSELQAADGLMSFR